MEIEIETVRLRERCKFKVKNFTERSVRRGLKRREKDR